MVARDGVEPSTFRFSVGRSYQLSYLAVAGGEPGAVTIPEAARPAAIGTGAGLPARVRSGWVAVDAAPYAGAAACRRPSAAAGPHRLAA